MDLRAITPPADLESLPLVFRDALGERRLYCDREAPTTLALWRLRPELAVYRALLAQQAAELSTFRHPRVGRVHGLVVSSSGQVLAVTNHVPGLRVSGLVERTRERREVVDINAALYLVRTALRGLEVLERGTGLAHGAVGLERIVLTPRGRLVLVEPLLGRVFAHLGDAPGALWRLFGVAWPRPEGAASGHPDVVQVAVALLSLLGRPPGPDEYPDRIDAVLMDACEMTALGRTRPLSTPLREWLAAALGLAPSCGFVTVREAREAFETVIADRALYSPTQQAFVAFLERIGEAPLEALPRAGKLVHVVPERAPEASGPSVVTPGALPATAVTRTDDAMVDRTESVPVPASLATPTPVVPSRGTAAPVVLDGAVVSASAPVVDEALAAKRPGDRVDSPPPPPPADVALPVAAPPAAASSPLRLKEEARWPPAPSARTTRAGLDRAVDADDEPEALPRPGAKPSLSRWLRVAAAVLALAAADGQIFRLAPGFHVAPAATESASAAEALASPAPASTGTLTVTTEPAGARVTVDGVGRGAAPVVVRDLRPGRHIVLVDSDRGTVRRIVRLEAGQALEVHIPLLPGFLAVSAPIELEILEGGTLLGTTESGQILLAPGRHDIEVVNGALAFRDRRTVEIQPTAMTRLVVEPPPGMLNIESVPPAEVWIDGQQIGETPLAGISVPIGTREIVFKHPTLGERREVVTVTAAGPLHVSVTFP